MSNYVVAKALYRIEVVERLTNESEREMAKWSLGKRW
jgi:hypothetical protein